ncbi:urokinase plasminogen activator surface receptor-like, partial [Onychostoma macrolepis]|uniref:urokinase plasminogen activator surface receptor-like n=1 Tax=Onychostoma macrolepis TaxID=369639 RepID=UPI00272D9CD5
NVQLNCSYHSCVLVNSTTLKVKSCAPSVCPSGSVNLGIGRVSSVCCNTDLCNAQDAPDLSNNAPNGKKCYYCDGQSCSNTVSCSGSECNSLGGQPTPVKGCASKSICDAPNLIPTVDGVSCCEGNLCNGAQSVTQSFLFLCCSLLSFILLH